MRGEPITSFDDHPIDELLYAEIRPYICASTPPSSDLEAARMLAAGEPGSRVRLRGFSLLPRVGKRDKIAAARTHAGVVQW